MYKDEKAVLNDTSVNGETGQIHGCRQYLCVELASRLVYASFETCSYFTSTSTSKQTIQSRLIVRNVQIGL